MAIYDLDNNILYVDNSTLSALVSCSTRAMLRYGYNVVPANYVNVPMQAGIAMHAAMEAYYCHDAQATQDASDAAIAAFLNGPYPAFARDNVEAGDRYDTENLIDVLNSWFEQKPLNALPYIIKPDLIEIPFDAPISDSDSSIRFVGRIDAIVEAKTHLDALRPEAKPMRFVLDNKTTGQRQLAWNRQWRMSSQLSGYIYAAQDLFREYYSINAAYINKIDTGVVPNSNRKCARHGVPYAECGWLHPPHEVIGPEFRSPPQIDNWRRNFYALASKWRLMLHAQRSQPDIQKLPQEGQFGYNQCNHCEYADFCLSGRPSHYDWKHEEWMPGDTANYLPDNRLLLNIDDV